jgi:phosphoribosylformimino-5-aminoimidazole carboxamide ribotide isomerase
MIEIVPAIDVIEGKCVRLTQGDYAQKKVYNEDPVEVAKRFEDAGIQRLHLVDLDGAKAQHIINYRTLEKITSQTALVVDFGGGLKTDDDLRIAFECGAAMVTGGSIAAKDPEVFSSWITKYGSDKIILGSDVKDEKIVVSGWLENTTLDLIPFIDDYFQKGIRKVICTDVNKDGMLEGTAVDLYKKLIEQFPDIYLIASGGVASLHDLELLEQNHIPSVIIGKAFYEGTIKLSDLTKR